jgi:molybdopterin-dependent oxidoreductase alpha subunit
MSSNDKEMPAPDEVKIDAVTEPSGGWHSVKGLAGILIKEHVVLNGTRLLMHQNKPEGFACVSCSWAKPANPHTFEFCANGAKATAWEATPKRTPPWFFLQHTVSELRNWSDMALEQEGRLTAPLRYDAATDRYLEVSWQQAFDEIGAELKRLDPQSVVFYSSGRASLEASYMYQLMARMYGNNNLPDSSNMCHESTSVGLQESIGVGVGTITLDDFEHTDLIMFFGQNVGVNSPRMLHQLKEARDRGVSIITFNPMRERGLVAFVNPQSPLAIVTGKETAVSTTYHQLRIGGDIAAIMGICKALLANHERALLMGEPAVLDLDFIKTHTLGFEAFAAQLRETDWGAIEAQSGLTRAALEETADQYARAKAVIALWGMGLTQHREGVANVQTLVNLLLMRGNIGKPGAGPSPVRGHSNVQGQRTVGITEKPDLIPVDVIEKQYGFKVPEKIGTTTVDACQGVLDGSVRAFIGLGGNFVRAVPDTTRIEPAWQQLRLTVQIATKLNRSHLINGAVAYLLPCLGRTEIDRQASGEQAVSMEDSTGCMHGSRGFSNPASELLLSEPAIVAGIAKATLAPNPKVDWDAWVGNYASIRDAIAATFPKIFHDFNARMWTPGGFHRPLDPVERKWPTKTGKANFVKPESLVVDDDLGFGGDILQLMTVRSDDQFNTTIYNLNDSFRGISGSRMVLLMNIDDMAARGLNAGQMVSAETAVDDGIVRRVERLQVVPYSIPRGCAAGYYPELNPLVPLWHHAKKSKVPASKSIPVRLFA